MATHRCALADEIDAVGLVKRECRRRVGQRHERVAGPDEEREAVAKLEPGDENEGRRHDGHCACCEGKDGLLISFRTNNLSGQSNHQSAMYVLCSLAHRRRVGGHMPFDLDGEYNDRRVGGDKLEENASNNHR